MVSAYVVIDDHGVILSIHKTAPTMRQSGMVWAGVRSILDRAS